MSIVRSRLPVLSLVVGVVLILCGLAMWGYVAWQYYGTDVLAKNRQSDVRDRILARWKYPTVSDVLGPQSSATQLGDADALVRITAFGADYEVPLVEGVRDEDLANGIGHFPGAGPGQIGNFALVGHQETNGEPFRDLATLAPKDTVIVETGDATYTYELDTDPNDLVLPFTDSWVIESVPIAPEGEAPAGMPTFDLNTRPTEAILTLTSSSELFHTDTRLIAFGHLVSTTPK